MLDNQRESSLRIQPQQEKLVKELLQKMEDDEDEDYMLDSELHEICGWLNALKLPTEYLDLFVLEGFDNLATIRYLPH